MLFLLAPAWINAQSVVDSLATEYSITAEGFPQPSPKTGPVLTTGADTQVTLSLRECIDIALRDNPSVKIADMEVQRVDYSKLETRGSLLPSVSFSGAYQRAIALQTMSMSMGGQTQSIKMGRDNTWNFGFTASVPIIAPSLWKALQISDTQILQNLETARTTRLSLVNQINKAYYALLLAQASYEVVKQNYDVAVFNAETYQKQFNLGTATEYDVLRSSVQVKNIEPELLQAQIAIRQCQLQLKVLMGLPIEIDILPDVTLEQMRSQMQDRVATIDRSLTDNPDVRSLALQTRLAKQNVELKKMAWLPTLGAQYSYNWSAMSNGNALKNQEFNPYSTLAISLSLPIFSGGSKYYAVRQAQVQHKELGLQRENLMNSLNMQVELALDNIEKELMQIQSNAEGVRQAVKAHQIMERSFQLGAATYLNLRDAELAETTAKLTYNQAIYNYLVSVADLNYLVGDDSMITGSNTDK